MALQRKEIFQGIVQDPEINSGRPVIGCAHCDRAVGIPGHL